MLTCSDEEIRALLDPAEVIAVIRDAFFRGLENVEMPTRMHVQLADGAVLLIMPCHVAGESLAGVKLVTVSSQHGPKGCVLAHYILLEAVTGATLASFEANYLTDLRTAATSAVATDLLARTDSATLGIFGTGRQAEAHISVLPQVRAFRRFLVSGTVPARVQAFASAMRSQYGIGVEAADARGCVEQSDVICTCTTSPVPLFQGEWIRPGTHLNLIGAFQPHTREVDSAAVRRARVFVDTQEGAMAGAGEILIPLQNGEIRAEHVVGDLHELVSGNKPGRTARDDITVFKSVGCALEDLVTARLVVQKVQRANPTGASLADIR